MNFSRSITGIATLLVLAATPVLAAGDPADANSATTAQEVNAAEQRPVLLITVDGLSPDTLLSRKQEAISIPVLRGLLREGSYARRVINVNPTVTNPNHTSLITGVSPVRHGVFNNRPFSPVAKLPASYTDYASIKSPTLWSAAKMSGLKTASLYWPVTRNAGDIDVNITAGDPKDDRKITDEAIRILSDYRPHLMTVHYVSYDSAQHEHGPGVPQSYASLTRIDEQIGKLVAAFRSQNPRGVVAIASDHGFDRTTRQVNLNIPLADAGFITFADEKREVVQSWRAFAWYVGASAMVVLNDNNDPALEAQVGSFLKKWARRPDSGIEKILEPENLTKSGLSPDARFMIVLKPGYRMGNAMSGPYSVQYSGGSHGAFTTASDRKDMHSTLLLVGAGIKAGKNLGTIDMRQIAPTLAHFLHVPLDSTDGEVLFESFDLSLDDK